MILNLDPATEQRIQREIDLGHYAEPAQVIAHALNLLDAEEERFEHSKQALNERLERSMAQIERGEGIPGDQLLDALATRRQARSVIA